MISPAVSRLAFLGLWLSLAATTVGATLDVKSTESYRRIRTHLDRVPAIDTHDHLKPFEIMQGTVQTDRGVGMTLYSMWSSSYYSWIHQVTPWPKSGKFEEWWPLARNDFENARATSFYRYQLSAFTDLYGVDFETVTDAQAADLNRRIFENYRTPAWVHDVVTNRANIELMLNDPYWDRFNRTNAYPFGVNVVNVTRLLRGFHPTEYPADVDSPYRYAREQGLPLTNLDEYLAVVEHWLRAAKAAGAVCLKTTVAYERTLNFERVPKEEAARLFGRARSGLSPAEVKAFEDYVQWQLVALSAAVDLPFQIHTGHARIQGSNPMLLVDLIAAHPKTKFILFHGGYPWVGETGAIMQRHGAHVWIDTVWLPTISYTVAKRAYQEFLELMPSNRLLWGADAHHAEGIYGATEWTRRCLAEALAEKVERGELREAHAMRIGQQVLRDNALELFPSLKSRLWRQWDGG
ncbi:MAG: amidohydrolase family protein [Verrucomicrobiales bacterium]|nr:amidohydrolase family protein [Verrucomicrobiales bacterium]